MHKQPRGVVLRTLRRLLQRSQTDDTAAPSGPARAVLELGDGLRVSVIVLSVSTLSVWVIYHGADRFIPLGDISAAEPEA